MAGKKNRPSLSAMEEFDLEAKIQRATQDGINVRKEQEPSGRSEKETDGAVLVPTEKRKILEKEYFTEKKQKKTLGRPKKNPYSDEKKLTIRMPEALHRQLRFASADTGKPMVEIAVDALIRYLVEYERQ